MPDTGPILSRRQIAASLVAGVAVALGAAGVASGGGGQFFYTDANTTVPNDTQGTTSQGCQDSPVVGGGVYMSGSDLGTEVNSSYPYDDNDANMRPDDGWKGYGINDGSGVTQSMRVHLICPSAGSYVYRDRLFEFAPNSHRTGRQSCPGDTALAGGGVYTAGGGLDDELIATFPFDDGDPGRKPDDGWSGTSITDDGVGFLRVVAICSASRKFRYVQRSTSGAPQDQFTVRVPCRDNEYVVGGGARVSKPGPKAEIASLHPFDDNDAGSTPEDGYQGWANNESTTAERKLTAFAVCA
jgi:hypothetical protein